MGGPYEQASVLRDGKGGSEGREFADQVVTVRSSEVAPRVRRGEEERDLLPV